MTDNPRLPMSDATNKAVFLSYASQDAEAARRIADVPTNAQFIQLSDSSPQTNQDKDSC